MEVEPISSSIVEVATGAAASGQPAIAISTSAPSAPAPTAAGPATDPAPAAADKPTDAALSPSKRRRVFGRFALQPARLSDASTAANTSKLPATQPDAVSGRQQSTAHAASDAAVSATATSTACCQSPEVQFRSLPSPLQASTLAAQPMLATQPAASPAPASSSPMAVRSADLKAANQGVQKPPLQLQAQEELTSAGLHTTQTAGTSAPHPMPSAESLPVTGPLSRRQVAVNGLQFMLSHEPFGLVGAKDESRTDLLLSEGKKLKRIGDRLQEQAGQGCTAAVLLMYVQSGLAFMEAAMLQVNRLSSAQQVSEARHYRKPPVVLSPLWRVQRRNSPV